MTHNYIIEDGINFWEELNKEDNAELEDSFCLLTKLPLTRNHISLDCGHKFNYIPLFEEIIQQKTRKVYINPIQFSHTSQFYCPYCRKVMNGLLPYIPTEYFEKIKNINYPSSLSIKHHECLYVYKSGKNKNSKCSSTSAYETNNGVYCDKHQQIVKTSLNKHSKYSDNKNNNININNTNTNEYNEIYKKYTIPQLKFILKSLNLPVNGNKKILVERYIANNKKE